MAFRDKLITLTNRAINAQAKEDAEKLDIIVAAIKEQLRSIAGTGVWCTCMTCPYSGADQHLRDQLKQRLMALGLTVDVHSAMVRISWEPL